MISIIIAVYNEEKLICRLVDSLRNFNAAEVIIVDGGSTDSTINVLRRTNFKILLAPKGRASQMNAGAKVANGDILLFLHADCLIDHKTLCSIKNCIAQKKIGGALTQVIDNCSLIYWWIAFTGNLRAKLTRVYFGDQAIFIKKKTFFDLGLFDDVELFEDVLLSKKMKKYGKTVLLKDKVITSSRRWKRNGIVKTTLINILLNIGFLLGIRSANLKKMYLDLR